MHIHTYERSGLSTRVHIYTHTHTLQVPAYGRFINDIFERCLDLYLCPRMRRKRLHVDPESLVPKVSVKLIKG
jgi:hypothetical protein